MALTMLDKPTDSTGLSAWPGAVAAECERKRVNNNGSGESKVHDLENIGDESTITVEFLDSANSPLSIPERARTAA
jgi:hypothetical protein